MPALSRWSAAACLRASRLWALGQHRSTQRKLPRGRDDEQRLTADIIELARQYGRYGYRKVAELLRQAGWIINDKRVERIWRREGLKVPPKQPKRGRLWLANGSCIRLRPEHRNHVWSYDFVEDRTHDGRKYRMLNVEISAITAVCVVNSRYDASTRAFRSCHMFGPFALGDPNPRGEGPMSGWHTDDLETVFQ